MANEKIVNREVLKEVRSEFQDKLETAKIVVGESKTISALNAQSGSLQDAPFILEGTGTNNNVSPVDSSPIGKEFEKQGNTVCYNQLIDPTSEFPLDFPTISGVRYLQYTGNGGYLIFTGTGSPVTMYSSDFKIVNLDKWFNGNIPADILSNASHFAWYYSGSFPYNNGELISCNARYLISTGRNAWNEEWEAGGINSSTGQNINVNNAIRSKTFSRCIPGVRYRYNIPSSSGSYSRIFWYDKNKTYISASETFVPATFTAPPHAYYFKIGTSTTYGNTYNNNITVSIYYSIGEDYDKYFPYTSPITYDTGDEVLRSVNSVRDKKSADGTITRYIGTRAYQSGDDSDDDVITDGTYTYYVLDTPTTEQGTSFSETITIDDYGSLYWFVDTDYPLIPQGTKLFYPADYVRFIDSLLLYTNGSATSVALNSNLLPKLPGTSTDGTYILKATKSGTTITYSWVSGT
jgi:hypothetical protein